MSKKYLISAAILVSAASPAFSAISVSGSMNLVVDASMQGGLKTATDSSSDSFVGDPAVMGIFAVATATDGDTGGLLTVIGQGQASGAANSGSVHFQNYGWTLSAPSPIDAVQSVHLNNGGPDWSYTFKAEAAGTFTLDYDVFLSPGGGDPFGLQGWSIDWSGNGGGQILGTVDDPTDNGLFVRSLIGGETYTVSLSNNTNLSTTGSFNPGRGMESTRMNGDFVYTISEAAVPEPASWAMFISGFGVVGGVLRARRRAAVNFG
jgi:hypothetical protein